MKKTANSLQPANRRVTARGAKLSAALLAWYDRDRRRLPWRYAPGAKADPYAVWLSEIMLQQTTVAAVKPFFEKFMTRWPRVEDLAAAPLDDVLTAWAGLGYYARARNLHRCAQTVATDYGGKFPESEMGLRALPGIGPYTAAAVAAIAFGQRTVVVDGNVERVMARLHDIDTPLPAAKPELHRLAAGLTPDQRAGDYAQAVMDLGATICTPKSPACGLCPWRAACAARKRGTEASRPQRIAKKPTPIRHGIAFWLERPDGAVLIRRRPAKGLLGGMMEIPSTAWRAAAWLLDDARRDAPGRARWSSIPGVVEHTFTHFHLRLNIVVGRLTTAAARNLTEPDQVWVKPERAGDYALPNVMRKVVDHVLSHRTTSPRASGQLTRRVAVPKGGSKIS